MTRKAWKVMGVASLGLALCLGAFGWYAWWALASLGAAIQESHVEGNVPAAADFEPFLRRDLERYFNPLAAPGQTVEYTLLRQGPTQSGVAYPKYYAWVRVRAGGDVLTEGAARIAAVDRVKFEVTHFVPRAAILADPSGLYQIFPEPVCDRIFGEINRDSAVLVGVH